ncbi:MAG: adenylate/guanylate cyclase domain-containing protein [Pseudomonadota bacterium]
MARWFSRWIGLVRIMGMLGLLFVLVIRVGDPGPVSGLRNAAFDFYHQIKPREPQPLPVAILDIDDRSIEEIGQWPWPRSYIARMVRAAREAGAVAVAFDVIFSEPDRLSPRNLLAGNPDLADAMRETLGTLPDYDELLAQEIAQSRVIVGQTSVRTVAGNREEKREMAPVQHAIIGEDPRPFLIQFPDILQNLPVLEDAATGRGMFSVRPDRDGIYRRVPVVMSVQGQIRLGLTPELLRVATGGDAFAIRTNEAGIDGVVIARQLIPTARDGTIWPYLTPSSRARYVSAGDLIEGRLPQGRLEGHLVLVGTSAIGLEDFRPTALGVSMAGVEVHAQVLENMMAQSMLTRPNTAIGVELVTTLLLGTLVILFAPNLGARVLISASLIVLTGYVGVTYYLFAEMRLLYDPTFPVLVTLGAVMLMASVNYLREERQRRQIRSAFGQYVSPDLVDQLSRNQEQLTLGGESRDLTLLFSDVRGFTAIAEQFRDDPEGLTRLMNEFLTLLSNAILAEKGTIDKFMGDAVMAFWNAPLDHKDHAHSACNAALEMIAAMDAFNEGSDRENVGNAPQMTEATSGPAAQTPQRHRLNVGIGINTGQCVVGNMGSDNRFDYTALGDPVNVASRLEGQSRYYGAAIILGQNTAQAVEADFALLELDRIRVVGKALPETIFALLGNADLRNRQAFSEFVDANAAMLRAYRAQDWDGAERMLPGLRQQAQSLDTGLDTYFTLYSDRVREMRKTPPDPDWGGVYDSAKK